MRHGDGQYTYGSKKIFAKIMSEKLVIRVAGGYMLVDEFLKNYADAESKIHTTADQVWTAGGTGVKRQTSPRASPRNMRAGSPNATNVGRK